MNNSKLIFWNVDTQSDFVEPWGKLYVQGADLIKPNWKKLTELAKNYSICVVNTADWHYSQSAELSENPDYVSTFPQHCMAGTKGAEFVTETSPESALVIDWDKEMTISEEKIILKQQRNYIIRKDAFDVFKGNRYTEELLSVLAPETAVVYGVTTNVCVNDAVVGLAQRIKRVIVVADAIKELPNIPLPFENWRKLGVELRSLEEVENLVNGL